MFTMVYQRVQIQVCSNHPEQSDSNPMLNVLDLYTTILIILTQFTSCLS